MKTFARIKFWSLPIFGFLFLLAGSYFHISGRASSGAVQALFIAGVGQLAIFYILLFYLYKGKLKNARKK